MFPSFTGNVRPKRQVNLSGRNSNPFTAHSNSRPSPTPQNPQNALLQAQQERLIRQQERERPPAAIKIQKSWRGHSGRRLIRNRWRHEWDIRESWTQEAATDGSYQSAQECLAQLRLLGQFVISVPGDLLRLQHFSKRYLEAKSRGILGRQDQEWTYPLLRLAKITVKELGAQLARLPAKDPNRDHSPQLTIDLLKLLQAIADSIPSHLARYSRDYYRVLGLATRRFGRSYPSLLRDLVLALLATNYEGIFVAYAGFINEFLTLSDLPDILEGLDSFESALDYQHLIEGMSNSLSDTSPTALLHSKSHSQLLWLLAYFIHFCRSWAERKRLTLSTLDIRYIRIVSALVSFLADDISSRVDAQQFPMQITGDETSSKADDQMPGFVQSEISSLVNQESISSLLSSLSAAPEVGQGQLDSQAASTLASYALMLLRVFPRRGDEIRMWLYKGSTSPQLDNGKRSIPAVKYFYQAAKETQVYRDVISDPRATVHLIRPEKRIAVPSDNRVPQVASDWNQQWRIVLLFLELYTFPLKIMDDEEFLSGSSTLSSQHSWTRQSALSLAQIGDLAVFLKNLAFALYWYPSEISGAETTETSTGLAEYFGKTQRQAENEFKPKSQEIAIAGVSGLSVEYVKGLVTGVLRMLYERDSRRKFLPRNHWLMTKYFEMDRFISAVVKEEEEKHRIERSYEDHDISMGENEESAVDDHVLIGTSHTQQIRNAERLRRQQQKASRRKYLESVTPRLEILQNMPFFIPFETRVEIFREFVMMDQVVRRGTADADEWRFAQINSPTGTISRHRAKVRRKSIFEDAFEQFYELGDGLKEPIQIRFVDEFDTVEEGIDGGGVTKEFLTSITSEAFGADNGLESLFIENDQHLLYPNPSTVEERKETLRRALYQEGSPSWNENIRDLLRRYEFLGRIIGKCLYEGILVDLHFAPFFLLKWALTGGSGSATKESGYRSNLNDLRDLDEGLYQGLLQLKNYSGNVEDFSLDFTVTDDLRISPTEVKAVTRELRPNGASTSVTNENRLAYITYVARYRLQVQPSRQTSAFLQGLGQIVSPSWLSMFNQSELQTLVSGTTTEVNIPNLRANTQYGGVYALGDDGMEHPSIQLFWKVMQGLSDADRKKVLKFVTSTPRAPLLGFQNLNPRFSIRDSGSDQTRLPSTSTCVNLLKLPIYRDEDTLRERLLYSVNSGAGFNLS